MQKNKEIETIKERSIKLNLSDADCVRISELCGRHNLTVSKLLENFIGDLVDGTYSNGSDEREFAERWFERCWFGTPVDETLLKWLLDYGIDVEEFLDLIDNIKVGYEELELYKKDPGLYDEEEVEYLKIDIDSWEEELKDYKSRYLKENSKAEWEKEIADVRKWFTAKKNMVECIDE